MAEVLEVIADDEARHAALAWKTLRWVLTQDPTIGSRLERLLRERLKDMPTYEQPGCAELGVLSGSERTDVERNVLVSIVGPVLRMLLSDVADRDHVSGTPSVS